MNKYEIVVHARRRCGCEGKKPQHQCVFSNEYTYPAVEGIDETAAIEAAKHLCQLDHPECSTFSVNRENATLIRLTRTGRSKAA